MREQRNELTNEQELYLTFDNKRRMTLTGQLGGCDADRKSESDPATLTKIMRSNVSSGAQLCNATDAVQEKETS